MGVDVVQRRVRVSPAAFRLPSRTARAWRSRSRACECAKPARSCVRHQLARAASRYGVAQRQSLAARRFRTATAWLTQSYRDGLMRTLRPRLPRHRSDTLRREYGEKRPIESRGFVGPSTAGRPSGRASPRAVYAETALNGKITGKAARTVRTGSPAGVLSPFFACWRSAS